MTSKGQPSKRDLPRLSKVGFFAFFCALAALVGTLGWTVATRRSIATELDQLKIEVGELRKLAREQETVRDQSSRDQEVLMRVFRHFRSGDDVPDLGGQRIVSNQIDSDSAVFYLPSGNHTLTVETSWEPAPAPQSAKTASDDETKPDTTLMGKQSWSIPLIAEHGYRFAVVSSSLKEGPLGWELSSGASAFPTQLEELPLPPVRAGGGSWSSHRLASFPNQLEIYSVLNKPTDSNSAKAARRPLEIASWTKFGRSGGKNLKVSFKLTVTSDNPTVITATDAETLLILQRHALINDYLGEGRYSVATD